MGAIVRFTGYLKDAWKFFQGQDDEIRKQTLPVQEQVKRLRERRLAQQKQQEEAVLRDARSIAEEMKSLEKRLNEAEAAVVEYVGKVAEKVKQQIEAELKHEHEIQKRILQEQEEKFKKTMESSFAEIEARAAAEEASKKESTK